MDSVSRCLGEQGCKAETCAPDTYDLNGSAEDGCEYSCVAIGAEDSTCDGVDDDCDGVMDEDFTSTGTSCGQGQCATTGVTTCTAGSLATHARPQSRFGRCIL